MSRTVCIIVLCPNGKRESIKVTPNTSILQVLEEACKKQQLNSEEYEVRHYNKPVDLSLPIRFANLPNNALLELSPAKTSRTESSVTVALQLESGERIIKDFLPSSSLEYVVQLCLSLSSTPSVQDSGEPVCIYMRQKLTGDDLRSTTLKHLGLTKGQAIIRLLYREKEDLEDQAHVSAPLKKRSSDHTSDEGETKTTHTELCNNKQPCLEMQENDINFQNVPGTTNDFQSVVKLSESVVQQDVRTSEPLSLPKAQVELMETENIVIKDEDLSDEIGNINYIGPRHAVVYNLDDITEFKKADLPDDFFELTINDVRYLMDDYKRVRNELENQPLQIRAQKQNKMLEHLAHYKQTVIRIYFPERLVLQATFAITETIQAVADFLKGFLENRNLPFYLYITPPKEILPPGKTLLEAMLVPAAVIYFGSNSGLQHYVSTDLRQKISDPRAASLAAAQSRKTSYSVEASEFVPVVAEKIPEEPLQDSFQEKPSVSKVPKWMKLSKT